jgi:hypothetical protein
MTLLFSGKIMDQALHRSMLSLLLLVLIVVPAFSQEQELPAFLKPGTRLIYEEGESVVHGVGSHLVPSKDGKGWVDNKGNKWDVKDSRNSGGVGFLALDVVYVAPDLIAADGRSIMLVDPMNHLTQSVGATALTGNRQKLGQYWVHPSVLAGMADARQDGQVIHRLNHEANGKSYNAISIMTVSPSSYESLIYDLETGLLLSSSRSQKGDPVATNLGGGNVGQAQGATVVSHSRFIAARELNIPWANEPAPTWAVAGHQMEYQGGYSAIMGGGAGLPPLPPLGMAVMFSFNQAANGCVLAKMFTRRDIGSGMPAQESATDRCLGTAMLTPLWISPRVLAQLQPNQVIDEDMITRLRLSYAGAQGNVGVFVEQGPLESSQNAYDLQTGALVAIRSLRAQGPNQMQMDLQLVRQTGP